MEVTECTAKSDATLQLKGETWAKLAMGETSLKQLVKSGQAKITGSKDIAYKVLGAFDTIGI